MIFQNTIRLSHGPLRGFILITLLLSIFDLMSGARTFKEPRSHRDPWNQDGELTPCEASNLVREVRAGFGKVIPAFSPDILGIRLQTEDGITVKATNPRFSQFLLKYYAVASRAINDLERENPRGRNPMLITFNSNYLTFLNNYGVPLTCISFYSGASSFLGVTGVQDLAKKLQNFSPRSGQAGQTSGPQMPKHFGLLAQEMIGKLGLVTSKFTPSAGTFPPGSYSPVCDLIFLKIQNGPTITNLPSVTVPPDGIRIPGQDGGAPIRTDRTNVTFLLSQYVSTGINCLGSSGLRANFSSSVCNWMETKLVPALLGTSNCFSGFPGILPFINSVKLYSEVNFERSLTDDNANVAMGWSAKYDEVKRQEQFGPPYAPPQYPPPEFKSLYYPEEPVVDDPGGEYAPLQEAQPQVIQNEVYPIPIYSKFKAVGDEEVMGKHEELTGPLMAGISITASLLLILVCCTVPLLCYYFFRRKSFRRRRKKVKGWLRKHFLDSPSHSSEEDVPILNKRKKRSKKCRTNTKLNIKVNDNPVAEVIVTEGEEDDSEDEHEPEEDTVHHDMVGYLSEGNFEHSAGGKVNRGQRRSTLDKTFKPAEVRVSTEVERPQEAPQEADHRRTMRRPTPADLRPPLPQVHSYENRAVPRLTPVREEKPGGGNYKFLETTSDESLVDIEVGRARGSRGGSTAKKTKTEEFYETKMAKWANDDNNT